MSEPPTLSVSEPRGESIRWVFLDRDGTLNVKPVAGEYVERPEDLELLPGAVEAIRAFNRAGMWTGVVTNQRGVALGRMTTEELDAIHERLRDLLAAQGAFLDAIYACPHQIGTCDCRKPDPGMLLKARREHPGLDFAHAAIVGDSPNDIQAGRRVGVRTVMISADGSAEAASLGADHLVANIAAAVGVLIGDQDHSGRASVERRE
jgi:D-glycero-D-manno-heptose 1,7-bisphosphate phosphatase